MLLVSGKVGHSLFLAFTGGNFQDPRQVLGWVVDKVVVRLLSMFLGLKSLKFGLYQGLERL